MSEHHIDHHVDHHIDHHIDIDKHVRNYMIVFAALMVLTVITVAVSYLHLSVPAALALGLFIATIKGALVAGVFMHLIDEKKFVYWVLAMTAAFFAFLLLIPYLTSMADQVKS